MNFDVPSCSSALAARLALMFLNLLFELNKGLLTPNVHVAGVIFLSNMKSIRLIYLCRTVSHAAPRIEGAVSVSHYFHAVLKDLHWRLKKKLKRPVDLRICADKKK